MNSSIDEEEKFKIYPVPASDYINLTSTISDELNYQLYDMQGRVLLTGKFSNFMYLNLENLPTGNYVIRLYNANEEHREKIIISR